MRNEQRRPEVIYIENEGFVPIRSTDHDRAFRFCRMFNRPNQSQPQHETDMLVALGMGMKDSAPLNRGNTSIPAGFVYLAQFVNHDIVTDWTQLVPPDQLTPEKIAQGRSPSLNLDSIYGGGPDNYPDLYDENNKNLLKLNKTTKRARFKVNKEFNNDLPRRPMNDPEAPKRAIIGNPLNDENLILAQTHVAFLKFHNQVVEHLRGKVASSRLFKESRKMVVQHYQSIVLHDLLPKFIIDEAYDDVVQKNLRRLFYPRGIPKGERPALPVEFSHAAFRFGHSMVRNSYEWNDVFRKEGVAKYGAKLSTLFRLSKFSGGLLSFASLPSDWVIDWQRFYDFRNRPGASDKELNFARLIDTKLASTFERLPEFAHIPEKHMRSLAVRDLLVGQAVGLPSGQDLAEAMRAKGIKTQALLPHQIGVARGRQPMDTPKREFDRQTPLWYYILQEATVQQRGEKLGHVGSYIVAETLHALVEASKHSILREESWKPEPSLGPQDKDKFTMVDLLMFVKDIDPVGDYLEREKASAQ